MKAKRRTKTPTRNRAEHSNRSNSKTLEARYPKKEQKKKK
jgi:hypothetical protein